MRRFLIIVIPIVTLLLFVFIMISGNILKKPFGEDDNIPKAIDDIIKDVKNEAWEEAGHGLETLNKAWDKVLFRIQFGSERDEINQFNTSLARLQGAVEAEDISGALMELYEVYSCWDGLGN